MKRLVAPFIITIFVILIFIGYVIACFYCPLPVWGKAIGILGSLGLIGVAVYVFIERLHKVRSSEQDDLSKY